MALIPSESLNFPDSFRASVGWRLPKQADEEPQIAPTLQSPGSSQESIATPKQPEPTPAATPVEPAPVTAKEPVAAPPPTPVPKIVAAAPAELIASAPPKVISAAPAESIAPAPVEQVGSNPVSSVSPDPEVPEAAPGGSIAEPAPVIFEPETQEPGLPSQASSAAPPLSVSGPAAQALIAQIFQMHPPADAKIEPVRPESLIREEAVSAKPGAVESKPAEPVMTPLRPDIPVAQAKSDHKPGFSLTSLPGDVPRQASAMAPVPPLKAVPAEPATPGNSETPGQNNHILELIAAAAQRGVLADAPAGEPSAGARQESVARAASVSPTTTNSTAPQAQVHVAVPEKKPATLSPGAPTSPAIDTLPADSVAAAKTPAKIRIQPRKIRPRPVAATPELTSTVEVEPIHPTPPPKTEPEHFPELPAAGSMVERPRPAWDLQPPGRAFEAWEAKMPPRKITAGRLDTPAEDFGGLFAARDRRNRLIRFGVCEAAAVMAFILLLHFALTHKFPDPTLKLLIFILSIAAAAIAVALPIAFIRNSPNRWEHR